MKGNEIKELVRKAHVAAAAAIDGNLPVEEAAQAITRVISALFRARETILPGHEEEMLEVVAALEYVALSQLRLNSQLLPLIKKLSRRGDVEAPLAILSMAVGLQMDRTFEFLHILAEMVGLRDGSVSFPEETLIVLEDLPAVQRQRPDMRHELQA